MKKLIPILILTSLLFSSCEKKPVVPVLTTRAVTDITTTTAVSGGEITNDGGAAIIVKGICWNTSEEPTIENNNSTESSTSAIFSSSLSNLAPGTTYYVRAYATNSAGTGYGESVTFKTMGDKPVAQAKSVSNITINSATLTGSVNPNLLSTAVSFEWGTSINYGNTILAPGSPASGSASSDFSADLTGLAPGTTYHFRVKAINGLGTTNSDDMQFTTLGKAPSVTNQNADNITVNASTITGSVNPNHLSTTVTVEWGTSTSYGSIFSYTQNPLTGDTPVNITAELTGLSPGTTYHCRISATNALGTSRGNDLIFKTLGDLPSVQTVQSSNLQYTSATIKGSVNPNYFSTTISIEWGTTTGYGNIITASPGILTGKDFVAVSADLTGLVQGTTYHFRITAANELGTTNSADLTFTTLAPITDIEGNVYNIRTIGTQVWMTENLKTAKYNNGDLIGTTSPLTKDISGETTPKYQWAYEGNEANVETYGRLYTGYAVTDPRKVCPSGWHIPSDDEWTTLTDYLINNGYGYQGSGDDIGKSIAAKSLWAYNSTPGNVGNDLAGNNSSGFSALPAGYRSNDDNVEALFVGLNWLCSWWSSTDLTDKLAWQRLMQNQFSNVTRSYFGGKRNGISVRCIKDQAK